MSLLSHSKMTQPPGARLKHSAIAVDGIETITAIIRSPHGTDKKAAVEKMAAQLPHERRYLSVAEFEQVYGSTADDLDKVVRFAEQNGFKIIERSSARNCVEF